MIMSYINSNRQLLNSYLRYLSVIASLCKPINLPVPKTHSI